MSIATPQSKKQLSASDLAIEALAESEARLLAENRQLRADNRALVELLADIWFDQYVLRLEFVRLLRVVDDVRLEAQRERDEALARREREAA